MLNKYALILIFLQILILQVGIAQERKDYTIVVDDKLREFIVVKPTGEVPIGGYPVVFMFHGTSGNGNEFYNISGWKEKGQVEKFITVFPTSLKYCILNFPNNNPAILTRWVTGDLIQDQCPNLNQDFKDDIKFVRMMLDDINSKYEINDKKVFAAGFSNGCSFSHKLAIHASDIFAACGGVGSILFPADSILAEKSIPFWNIIGNLDDRFLTVANVNELPFNDSILIYMNQYINRMNTCLGLSNEHTLTSTLASLTYIYSKPKIESEMGKFQFSLIKNMNHIYPNGVNFPLSATNFLWEFFNQSTLTSTNNDHAFFRNKIKVYPNPVIHQLSIQGKYTDETEIQIFNAQGRKMDGLSFHKESESMSVDVSHLPTGLYLLHVDGESSRFIKY